MSSAWSNLAISGRALVGGLIQLIYPSICWTCSSAIPGEQGPICSACLPCLTVDPFPTCPRCSSTVGPHLALAAGCPECAAESFAFDGAFRMAPYADLLRDVILRMKRWTGEDLAEVIAGLWAKKMAPRLSAIQPDLVIPVPLHWTRRWRRGFNASEFLATRLAGELRIPCWPRALLRVRATAQQTEQTSAEARRQNVRNAFAERAGSLLNGRRILLVDDVLTTGATASEAARALRVRKPASIFVAVLAHGR